MRIALAACCRYPPVGGTRLLNLFKPLLREHEIHVFYVSPTNNCDSDFLKDGFYTHILKIPYTSNRYLRCLLSRLFDEFFLQRFGANGPFDAIMQTCITALASLSLSSSRKYETPLFSDYSDLEIYRSNIVYKKVTEGVLGSCFGSSLHLFPTCNYLRDRLIYYYGVEKNKVSLIPNGVDTTMFRPKESKLKEKLGLSSFRVIGYLGALNKWVRIDLLLKAYKRLLKNYNDLRLIIVGSGSEFMKWRQYCHHLGISDSVIFTGHVSFDQVPKYISSFDIAVSIFSKSPFTDSISPLKVVQYISMGKAVVADNLSGTREYIKNMETGILFDPDNLQSLESALQKILDDENLKQELEESARIHALNYDWRLLSRQVEETMVNCLEQ